MKIQASVALSMDQFIATLSDGQRIERSELPKLAYALHRAGVSASAVKYEWRAGLRMMTAGQQVALCADMRHHERRYSGLPVAA